MKKFLLAFLIFFPHSAMAGNPYCPVLDAFYTGQDQAIDAGWTQVSGSDQMSIVANNAYGYASTSSSSNGYFESYWNNTTYLNSEVYVELLAIPNASASVTVFVRYNPTSNVAYELKVINNSPTQVLLIYYNNGSSTTLATYNQTVSSLDSIRLDVIDNVLIASYASGFMGKWVTLGSVVDNNITGAGYIGLTGSDSGYTPAILNFGGGEIHQAFINSGNINNANFNG